MGISQTAIDSLPRCDRVYDDIDYCLREWLRRLLFAISSLLLPTGFAFAAPFAYITNFASNNVSVIDTATDTVIATVPVGSSPFGVAVNSAGTRAYVTDSAGVSVIDATTNAVVAAIPVPASRGIAVNQAGTRVYVATVFPYPGIAVIDAATNTVINKVVTSDVCWGVAVNPAGTRVYATNEFANTVSVVDTATNSLITAVTVGGQPQGVVVNPAGTRVYVTNVNGQTISVIDTATNTVIATVPSANVDLGVAVNGSGTRVYVTNSPGNISVLDAATNTIVALYGVLGFNLGPQGIGVTPDGKRVYVANLQSDNVSVIDAVTNMMVRTVTVGSRPVAFGQFIGPAVLTPPGTTPDLNQHGLTGSWYEPATSGQGVEVEVFPNPSSGTGATFVSWFTYDSVIGGPERQRWYTAQGPVVTGQPKASLTIYQNTGGNFDAPPITMAQPVGTATLSFSTCTSGQLSYSFTDGTGRNGSIPLTRLTQNVTCSAATPYSTNADFALSGNWYGGAATSGQGLTVEVNPNNETFFATWYTYIPNGIAAGAAGQRWYTAQGYFMPGTRSIPVQLYETTGGLFDTATPPGQKTVAVGSGTMAFQSCSAATFSYNFTGGSNSGLSGSIALSRVGLMPPGCTS